MVGPPTYPAPIQHIFLISIKSNLNELSKLDNYDHYPILKAKLNKEFFIISNRNNL